ncbi:hypothetical protein HK101_008730 [Irineochytrium annulatum]|nr:hypothetical protein HK101_008730 [Irineochytrium annulatum]
MGILNSDVLALVLDELSACFRPHIPALHSCLLVSRTLFELAAPRLWSTHTAFDTSDGIGPSSDVANKRSDFDSINRAFVELCKSGNPAASANADGRRAWRCRVYLRSITSLDVNPSESTIHPDLITPLLGTIRKVTINMGKEGPSAAQAPWLDWIKDRMSSVDGGASEIVYRGYRVDSVLEFARFPCVTTVTVPVCLISDLEAIVRMILSETGVHNVRVMKSDEDQFDAKLGRWGGNASAQRSLRQLDIDETLEGDDTMIMPGFLGQFERLTHLRVGAERLSGSQVIELERCSATLTQLVVSVRYTTDEEACQIFGTLGKLVNLRHLGLSVEGYAEVAEIAPGTRFTAALANLVQLRRLTIDGDGDELWDSEGMSMALAGMLDLRDLKLDFELSEEPGPRDVDLVLRVRQFVSLAVYGPRRVAIADIAAIVRDGWRRLEALSIEAEVVGPGETLGSLVDATASDILHGVMLDATRTPSLLLSFVGPTTAQTKVVVQPGGGRDVSVVYDPSH